MVFHISVGLLEVGLGGYAHQSPPWRRDCVCLSFIHTKALKRTLFVEIKLFFDFLLFGNIQVNCTSIVRMWGVMPSHFSCFCVQREEAEEKYFESLR